MKAVPALPALVIAANLTGPLSATAQTLDLRDTWDWSGPASLAWDPVRCGLWVVGDGPDAVMLSAFGEELDRISPGTLNPTAVAVGPEGVLLVANSGSAVLINPETDQALSTFRVPAYDAEGVVLLPSGDLMLVEDDPAALSRLAPDESQGFSVRVRLNTEQLSSPLREPQGIEVDVQSGHLLIVDDEQGTDHLYEMTTSGRILGQVDLRPFGRDAEGVALHAASGTLWVAFDEGDQIGVFDYVSSSGGAPEPDACVPNLS